MLDKNFEMAVVKIQQGKFDSLTPAEQCSVKHLTKEIKRVESRSECDEQISFAERILKKQKMEVHAASNSEYIDLRFLIPSSNICERIFCKAGFSFSERRMAIVPLPAESQIFLHLNMDLWNIDTVEELLIND